MRALYLGDNDFETLPSDIRNLKNLQIVSVILRRALAGRPGLIGGPSIASAIYCFPLQLVLRDNDLVYLPKEIGELVRLRELHIQGNRLTILPPEIGTTACFYFPDTEGDVYLLGFRKIGSSRQQASLSNGEQSVGASHCSSPAKWSGARSGILAD